MKKKIVVFGAGMSGLATGLALAEKGFDVEIFEKSSFVGGMAASFEYAGFVFDYGPHLFHAAKTENNPFVKKVLAMPGLDLVPVASRASIVFKGKIFDYPLQVRNIIRGLSITYSFFCFLDLLKARLAKKLVKGRPKNFEEFIKKEYGTLLYNEYFGPYTKRAWNTDPKNLSVQFAKGRIPPISVSGLVFKAITGKEKSPFEKNHSHSPYKDLHYPKKGYGVIPEKFRSLFEKRGGKLFLETRLKQVFAKNGSIAYTLVEQKGIARKVKADFFVSTIPITGFLEIISPPPGVLGIYGKKQVYSSLVLLYLIVKKPSVMDKVCIYVADPEFEFSRISENKTIGANRQFRKKTGICIEFPCYVGDEMWNASKEKLLKISVQRLEKLGLLKEGEIIDAELKKLPNAYCISTTENEKQIGLSKKFLQSIKNLSTVGRGANFKYVNVDELIKDGFEEAEKISRIV